MCTSRTHVAFLQLKLCIRFECRETEAGSSNVRLQPEHIHCVGSAELPRASSDIWGAPRLARTLSKRRVTRNARAQPTMRSQAQADCPSRWTVDATVCKPQYR